MAAKSLRIFDAEAKTDKGETDWIYWRSTPDPYLICKSHKASRGTRHDHALNTFTPRWGRSWDVPMGSADEPEDLAIEMWDSNFWGADFVMEKVQINFASLEDTGSGEYTMSSGGTLKFSWEFKGRGGGPDDNKPVEGPRISLTRLVLAPAPRTATDQLPDFMVKIVGRSTPRRVRIASPMVVEVGNEPPADGAGTIDPPRDLPLDALGYHVEVWAVYPDNGREVPSDRGQFQAAGGHSSADGGFWQRLALEEGGVAWLRYEMSDTPAPEPPSPPPAPTPTPHPGGLATRREIRRMPRAAQDRFVAALKEMCRSPEGPGKSEYARLAGYHGWPGDYCNHGEETFPGWHRAYLCDFEQALQRADRSTGGDGTIGLPYWDWTSEEINGEFFPKVLREHFAEMPPDLVDTAKAGGLGSRGYQIRADRRIRSSFRSSRLSKMANDCLTHAEHWQHSSTRFNRQGNSLESPHNSVHVALGYPMTSVQYAAFHPVFFLHHCNVDRIYEKYVQLETPEECMKEFANQQLHLFRESGERDRFLEPLRPFRHPLRPKEEAMPRDTFNIQHLGYAYDELPPDPRLEMTAEPTYAAFLHIKPLELSQKSYELHVFLTPAGTAFHAPAGGPAGYESDPCYAGAGCIFGGRGPECPNCVTRKPFNVLVEVQDKLASLGLSRYEVDVHVVCEDEVGEVAPLAPPMGVPAPVLVGPVFEDASADIAPSEPDIAHSKRAHGEKMALLRLLHRYGFMRGKLDGDKLPAEWAAELAGPLREGVVAYQQFYGLPQDGIAHADMKRLLLQPRSDVAPDLPSGGDGPSRKFIKGSPIRYCVGEMPGYLQRGPALAEIKAAVDQWGQAMGVPFERTQSSMEADFRVGFDDLSPTGAVSDGLARSGGQLAEANAQGMTLDDSERWLLHGQSAPAHVRGGGYKLYNVVLHEAGHVLGLTHSSRVEDIMWPFYRGDLDMPSLSAGDIECIRRQVTTEEARFRRLRSLRIRGDQGAGTLRSSFASLLACCVGPPELG